MAKYLFQKTSLWYRFRKHLATVMKHKYFVAQGCFKIGLYAQGILHDMSKFYPSEFITGVKYFQGDRSPNSVERELYGCSQAWLHHKGRNKHHFEYWVDFTIFVPEIAFGCKMPLRYVAEMVCDRRAACIAYHGKDYTQADAWHYYVRTRKRIIMDKDTRAVLEKALWTMKEEGEDACFKYLRKLIKQEKGINYTAESLGLSYEPFDDPNLG